MRILIAEDDTTSRMVLQKTLQKLGYAVQAAKDGAEAWGFFEKERASVVITDWMMPVMDGLTLCRKIRGDSRNDRYTYLIVLTALGGKRNYLEAMDAGADDFLTKPFDADELVARLRVAERLLETEVMLRYCESLLDICPGCQRVRGEGGRWSTLRQRAEEASARRRPPVSCPDCQRGGTSRSLETVRAMA